MGRREYLEERSNYAIQGIVDIDIQQRSNVRKNQDRILVTHTGSLQRGEPLGSESIDAAALKKAIDPRVSYILNKQVGVGLDEVNDGDTLMSFLPSVS
jgi:hypothetical protein